MLQKLYYHSICLYLICTFESQCFITSLFTFQLPNDTSIIDHSAATILQMSSVPDGNFTDLGISDNPSLYDNEFDLHDLLPSNLAELTQLDNHNLDIASGNVSPSNGSLSLGETSMPLNNKTIMGDNNNMSCQQQQQQPLQQLQPQSLTVNNSLTITPQPMQTTSSMSNTMMQQQQPCSSSMGSLNPVTTISSSGLFNPSGPPMMNTHLRSLEPVPQSSLPKTLIKSEPVQLQPHQPQGHMGPTMPGLPYIKKEESNNFENNNFGNCGGEMSHPNIYSQQLQPKLPNQSSRTKDPNQSSPNQTS